MKLFRFKYTTLAVFLFFCAQFSHAQRGKEGDVTIAGNPTVNTFTYLTANASVGANSIFVNNNTMTGGAFGAPLAAGDLIMIIQMQGASMDINTTPTAVWGGNYTVPNDYISGVFGANPQNWGGVTNYGNSGVFQRLEVLSVSGGTTINLNCPLTKDFTASGHVQVIRIPRYNNLTIPVGNSITTTNWNGNDGGIVAIEVNGALTINGTITATGNGFRGGELDPLSITASGSPTTVRPLGSFSNLEGSEKGEGVGGFYAEYDAVFSRYGIGAPANGGGGGGYQNAGGGGGCNVLVGGSYTAKGNPIGFSAVWDLEAAGFGGSTSAGGGRGGYAISNSDQNELVVGPANAAWGGDDRKVAGGFGGHGLPFVADRVFAGGGGGAGDQDSDQGGAGGRGGGIVFIQAYGTVTGSGVIDAQGEAGQNTNPTNQAPTGGNPRKGVDGAGGGGGGGSVHIENISTIPASITINVRGGNGGNQNISLLNVSPLPALASEAAGPGGSGAGGLIRIGSGTPTKIFAGGTPGVTNSSHMVNFPPNGATSGSDGFCCFPNNPTYNIVTTDQSICSGATANLVATRPGTGSPLPSTGSFIWYDAMVGGTQVNTGSSFTTPALFATTTYWIGICPGSFRTPVTVTILPSDDASFSYAGSPYCANGANAVPVITGLAGGTFSSAVGLAMNAASGAIDVSGSTPGTYTITYLTSGPCPNSSTQSITISAVDDASFSYASMTYCVSEADPSPSITSVGGTFSSTAGLSINAVTGTIDLSASTPGAYTVTYTTSGTCPNSSTFSLTITTLEDASYTYSAASYCSADTDPTPTITGVSGGAFTSTVGISINAATGTIDLSASTTGTYTVTYTSGGSCSNTSTQSVTITALDDASFNYSAAAYCVDATDPAPTITGAAGGTFSSTAGLSINTSTGVIDVSTSTPGTYTVTYSIIGACANSSTVSVTINALDNATFSYPALMYCANAVDPSPTITGLAGGTFSSTTGLVINASSGVVDLSASTPGTYTVTYSTNGTCPNTSTVSVTVNAIDDASFNYGSPSYCLAQADPTPTITGLAGGTFSSTAGLIMNTATGTIDVSASTPGSYVVTYSTTGSCPNTATFNIGITALDDASFSYSSAAYCADATDPSPIITGVSGGTFSSTAGLIITAATGVIDASASTPGTYTVTYATVGICANSSNVSVTINALDDASFNYGAAAYCANDTDPSATITGLVGGSFSSTAGLVISNVSTGTVDVSASTPGVYTVTYTTAGTCPNTSTQSITINALDNASFSYPASVYCLNVTDPTATITGLAGGTFSSTAGLSINASTGTIDVSASTPGVYVVTYLTSGSCPNSSTANITINALDDASFSYASAAYCVDGTDPSATITGLAGGTFSSAAGLIFSNTSTGTIDVSASTPGLYTVTYTTAGTCPNTSTQNVTVNALDDASFAYGAAAYCADAADPSPSSITTAGGTFSSTVGLSINAATGAIDVSASTPGIYTITYTTAGACPNSSTVSITVNAMDDPSFNYASMSYCVSGTDPSAIITGLAGGTFTSSVGLVINAATGVIDVSASTIGAYTVTYTTNGTCPNSTTAAITILSADDAAFTMTATCDGGTASAPGTSGGTFTLVGSPAGVNIDGSTGTVTGGVSGTSYTVQYATSGACASSTTEIFTVLTNPIIDPITDITICDQAILPVITGTGFSGDEAFYNDTQGNGGVAIAGPITSSQTVYVYATNSGCTDEISFVITINTTDDPTFTLTDYCEGSNNLAFISGTTGGIFDFNPAVGDGATINASTGEITNGVAGTTYNVEYTTTGVCPSSSIESVLVFAIPAAPTASSDQTYCVGDAISPMTASTPSGTLNWYDDFALTNNIGSGTSQTPLVDLGTVTYYVTSTENGCEGLESAIVIVIENCDITVPTAFTPDGDGANDDWELVNIDVVFPQNIVKVYNRWGNLVFESPQGDYDNNRWDGTFKGELLPVGSYYFIIEPNLEGIDLKSGSVSVILGN